MFSSIKQVFASRTSFAPTNRQENIIFIAKLEVEIICDCLTLGKKIYSHDTKFYEMYIIPFVSLKEQSELKSLKNNLLRINNRRTHINMYQPFLENLVLDREFLIYFIYSLWLKYALYESNKFKNYPENAEEESEKIEYWFMRQFALLIKFLRSFIQLILCNPKTKMVIHEECKADLIERLLMNKLSQDNQFKTLMKRVINYQKTISPILEFSPHQILQTKNQLEDLIRISQIPAAFNASIEILIDFYEAHSIELKVKYLAHIIPKIKEEIQYYRDYFQLQPIIIGADTLLPVINFICERSNKKIYRALSFLKAVLGYNLQINKIDEKQFERRINSIYQNAYYSFISVENVSNVYSHSSQMI